MITKNMILWGENKMKKLLVDYIPFEVAPEALNEAMSSNGKLKQRSTQVTL